MQRKVRTAKHRDRTDDVLVRLPWSKVLVMDSDEFINLRNLLRAFAAERDWDQFHSPKNLAAALSVEAAELLEHFQWLSDEESRNLPDVTKQAAAEEIADVLLYLVRIADKLEVDLSKAARNKIELNASKYPVELARGNATKHSKLVR